MKAIWNGEVIAESNETVNIEGNHYFPRNSVKSEFFSDSETQTLCHWKGTASYFNIKVAGIENKDAAWYYSNPSSLAAKVKDYVAFWKGVEVVESN